MSRIIKYNLVNITEDAHKIDVPDKGLFAPEKPEGELLEMEEESPEELLRHAEEHAKEIIESAKSEAEDIIAQAKEQALKEKEAIYEEAKNEGFYKGYSEAEEKGQTIMNEADAVLKQAVDERERIFRETEPQIVALIIDIVERLIGGAVRLNPGVILHIVKCGLDGVPNAKELSIRVSPDDYDALTETKDEIISYVDSDTQLSFIKDTSLAQSCCVIDTPIGSVDSSIDTQWGALKNDLIQILKADSNAR